jgi:hypothetical protein
VKAAFYRLQTEATFRRRRSETPPAFGHAPFDAARLAVLVGAAPTPAGGRAARLPPVAEHHARPADEQLVVRTEAELDARQRAPDRVRNVVLQPVGGHHRRRLGQAVALQERQAETAEHPRELRRERRPAAHRDPHAPAEAVEDALRNQAPRERFARERALPPPDLALHVAPGVGAPLLGLALPVGFGVGRALAPAQEEPRHGARLVGPDRVSRAHPSHLVPAPAANPSRSARRALALRQAPATTAR